MRSQPIFHFAILMTNTIEQNLILEGALILAKKCAGIQPDEKILLVSDQDTRELGEVLAAACRSLSGRVEHHTIPNLTMHGMEPPAEVAGKMAASDVVFGVTSYSMAHTRARKALTDNGGRYMSLPDYSFKLLADMSLRADFDLHAGEAKALETLLNTGKRVLVRTDAGTELALNITGRRANCCPGVCREPSSLGSPPDIETNIAPVEDDSHGIIVVDGSIPCPQVGILKSKITLSVDKGRIVHIGGDPAVCDTLESLFNPYGPDSRVLAELGIGLNPKARLTGVMLTDEGCRGTVHFGFGSNATIGGANHVPFHLDFVLNRPIVYVDDRLIINKSDFVFASI